MKAKSFIVFLIITVFALLSCSDNKREERRFIIKDSITLRGISKTLDPYADLDKIIESQNVPDTLVSNWIRPFKRNKGKYNKILAYQFEGSGFHVLVMGIVKDLSIDSSNQENSWSDLSQYLLTVDEKGLYVDGIIVQDYIGGEMLEDSLVQGYKSILTATKWSEFRGDTIVVFDKILCLKETIKSERIDYIERPEGKVKGTLETVLQEEFEFTDETIYVIGSDGKIKKLNSKKGEPKKVSENTGERIKAP